MGKPAQQPFRVHVIAPGSTPVTMNPSYVTAVIISLSPPVGGTLSIVEQGTPSMALVPPTTLTAPTIPNSPWIIPLYDYPAYMNSISVVAASTTGVIDIWIFSTNTPSSG